MFHKFLKYISQSISGMIGVSVYILADTFFISYKCGADGLAALNLILPVFIVLGKDDFRVRFGRNPQKIVVHRLVNKGNIVQFGETVGFPVQQRVEEIQVVVVDDLKRLCVFGGEIVKVFFYQF